MKARISKQQHEAMLESHREQPGNINRAARIAKTTHRTAKKAYQVGWDRPEWARPIKAILADEERRARAELERQRRQDEEFRAQAARQLREEKELAIVDAARERARESQGVRAAVSNALTQLAVVGQFSQASVTLAQAAARDILTAVAANQMRWQDAVPLLTKLSWLGKSAIDQLNGGMEILRKHLGEPEKLLGVTPTAATKPLDGRHAAQFMGGEENLLQAVKDLAEGKMTAEVERLISFRVDGDGLH